jgi:hypothetical protein
MIYIYGPSDGRASRTLRGARQGVWPATGSTLAIPADGLHAAGLGARHESYKLPSEPGSIIDGVGPPVPQPVRLQRIVNKSTDQITARCSRLPFDHGTTPS